MGGRRKIYGCSWFVKIKMTDNEKEDIPKFYEQMMRYKAR
eukprot:gene26250-biopygen15281